MIDPITGGLMAAGLVGQLIQGQEAKKQSREALAFQMMQARNQERFAKAGRVDPFGNVTKFDDVLNQWITELTPRQRAIIQAGEREQLLGLTGDAEMNRSARRRQSRIGQRSSDTFDQLIGQLSSAPSEKGSMGELTGLLARARFGGSGPESGRQSLRQRGNVRVSSGPRASSGGISDLAQILLQARSGAASEAGSRRNSMASVLPALQTLAGMSGGGGNAPMQFSTLPQSSASTEADMAGGLLNALKSGAAGVQDAYGLATKATASQFPNTGDMARLISALRTPQRYPRGVKGYYGGSPDDNANLLPF